MGESDPLSLADLEAYGRVWGEGRERRALCPFCGDEHGRDRSHACLAVNAETGAWTCHRCERSGLLDEHKTRRDEAAPRRRRLPPRPAPPPADPPADPGKRETLRAMWGAAVPLAGTPAADYLEGRGIALRVAQDARARYAPNWYGRPAVVFPMQDAGGKFVAAEGRYTDGRTYPKGRSAGPKSRGVFVAMPGALEAEGVTLCEGPITALSLAAAGFPAVALCGRVLPAWLPGRLAFRPVLLSLDWYEPDAATKAAPMYRALVTLGAQVYRLAPPDGAGDWNDRLQAVGLATMRAELDGAVCGALDRA